MKFAKVALSFAVFVSGFAFFAMECRGRGWEMAAFGGLVGVLLWIVLTGQLGDWRDILYPKDERDTKGD